MNRFGTRLSAFIVGAMLIASLLNVCTEMLAVCGFGCPDTAVTELMAEHTADCTSSASCAPIEDHHMVGFANAYPSLPTNGQNLLLIGIALAVIAFAFVIRENFAAIHQYRARMRTLLRSHLRTWTPPFLVLAFQRGILHPKIYA